MPHLSWNEVKDRAIRFARKPDWINARSERADKQTFYNEFFDVFGIRRASVAAFETNVRNLQGHNNAIDLLWRGKLIAEHKSRGASLAQAETQAFGYIEDLTREGRFDEVPRFVLVSDFANFVLYDLEPEEQRGLPLFGGRPMSRVEFALADFPNHVRAFAFMLGQTRVRLDPEDPANEKAYARMCGFHAALKAGGFDGHDLEHLLVRILFCLFAEDTGLFEPESFTNFIRQQTREDGSDLGAQLNSLFDWLNNQKAENRLEDTDPLYGFRFVNGGLFADRLGFPRCTGAMRAALIECCEFHWAKISPAVFGSLFQGVIDDLARRQQGAHYTSERDIMKVIRSLFLDEHRAELEQLKRDRSTRRRANLEAFQTKLRNLKFLDPACGCGNFLVIAYRELRQLELEVIRELHGTKQQSLNVRDLCKVDVDQFYGIEISAWPVRIAEVAMWLIDHQLNALAAALFGQQFERLPLRASPHIVHANALSKAWKDILPPEQCSYVLGNPPFVGHQWRNAEQQEDMANVWGVKGRFGRLDYVTCWFRCASEYISDTSIRVGFVATNSITQGEQVSTLWAALFERGVQIDFAHRTFPWVSEARGKAHVHVVIIGFSIVGKPTKRIYDYASSRGEVATVATCQNINPFLVAGSNLLLPSRTEPRDGFPQMKKGSQPTDGGFLILTEKDKSELLAKDPTAKEWLRMYLGGEELINGEHRWCLWLKKASPSELRQHPLIMERVGGVRESRSKSPTQSVREFADRPTLFTQDRQPLEKYLAVPEVSSENRRYIPIAFLPPTIIASNKLQMIAGANLFHFGVLTSGLHMAWVRVVTGRLESRLSYAPSVYNNYPWPESATEKQRAAVEAKAQAVLDARKPHLPPLGKNSLADLYDPLSMPPKLVRAHAELDRSVEKCYRPEPFKSDRERVEHLFSLYEKLTAPLLPAKSSTRRRSQKPTAIATAPTSGRSPQAD